MIINYIKTKKKISKQENNLYLHFKHHKILKIQNNYLAQQIIEYKIINKNN